MIRRVTIRNFKRFREQAFPLEDSVVLAGPNNSGKSTLLQAIATWKFARDQWVAKRTGRKAVKRSGVAIARNQFTPVPLREMNLLWEDRRVTGPKGIADAPRQIEVVVEGRTNGNDWECGFELQYVNQEMFYVRPLNARNLDRQAIRNFPPKDARDLDITRVLPLSGIEGDEPRRDPGMQDLLMGKGRPGDILRNLLLEIANFEDPHAWSALTGHIKGLFGIEILKPVYAPAEAYILCEYRDLANTRPLDLASAGSGTLQVLLLLAYLYARPAMVILLDEPDAHQHVILQRQAYDLIRKVAGERGGQVIVATHSEVILDLTAPARVLGFFGGKPRALASKAERNQLREALKRITTTQLLLGEEVGSVLYVEGETDEAILREWARILDHPARQFFDRPFVHRLGGRSLREARSHFFALQAAFPGMQGICLLDGDNRDEPDAEMTKVGLKVLRWSRYEIENYLLQPDAIARFVGEDVPLGDRAVHEAFGKQVPQGTDLFGNHIFLARVKASEEFLIPLLESIQQGLPKSDLYRVAAVMQEREIHPEIREKLDRIAAHFALQ